MSQITGRNRLQHLAKTGGRWRGTGTPLQGHTLRYIYFLNPDAAQQSMPDPLSQQMHLSDRKRRQVG